MKIKIFSAIILGVMLSGAAFADGWEDLHDPVYDVTVANQSGYVIWRVYMGVDEYGRRHDVLGDDVLKSGYQTTFRAQAGNYDIDLVDEDSDHCLVSDVQIERDRDLVITRDMLLRCEGYR